MLNKVRIRKIAGYFSAAFHIYMCAAALFLSESGFAFIDPVSIAIYMLGFIFVLNTLIYFILTFSGASKNANSLFSTYATIYTYVFIIIIFVVYNFL